MWTSSAPVDDTGSVFSFLTSPPPSILQPPILLFIPLFRPRVCPSITLLDQGWRPRPLIMTADMWQFSCVNDERCANYVCGCSSANQTVTSCERVCVDVSAPRREGLLGQALCWILMIWNLTVIAALEITFPLNLRPHKRSPITGHREETRQPSFTVCASLSLRNFPPLSVSRRSISLPSHLCLHWKALLFNF